MLSPRFARLALGTLVASCGLYVALSAITPHAAETDARPVRSGERGDDQAIEARILADVKRLAADEWEGRGPGTAGLDKAADFIADEFKKAGLRTDIVDGKPFQPFSITISNKPGSAERNHLTFTQVHPDKDGVEAEKFRLTVDVDFTPLSIGQREVHAAGRLRRLRHFFARR
ncbi:MAG: hypothetical protein QM811_14635 [Pirellulales bacterium]